MRLAEAVIRISTVLSANPSAFPEGTLSIHLMDSGEHLLLSRQGVTRQQTPFPSPGLLIDVTQADLEALFDDPKRATHLWMKGKIKLRGSMVLLTEWIPALQRALQSQR